MIIRTFDDFLNDLAEHFSYLVSEYGVSYDELWESVYPAIREYI